MIVRLFGSLRKCLLGHRDQPHTHFLSAAVAKTRSPLQMLGFAMGSAGHRGKLGKSAMGQVGHRGKLATHDLTSSVLLCTIPAGAFFAKMATLGFDKPCAALYYSRRGFFSEKMATLGFDKPCCC